MSSLVLFRNGTTNKMEVSLCIFWVSVAFIDGVLHVLDPNGTHLFQCSMLTTRKQWEFGRHYHYLDANMNPSPLLSTRELCSLHARSNASLVHFLWRNFTPITGYPRHIDTYYTLSNVSPCPTLVGCNV